MVGRKYDFLGRQFSYLKAAILAMEQSVNIIELARFIFSIFHLTKL